MKKIIYNIKELIGILPHSTIKLSGKEMDNVNSINDAYLTIDNNVITAFGKMSDAPSLDDFDEKIDATDRMVIPSFCDSHTHICYAGTREGEFIDKINGLSYEEIAARGGGILNSSDLLHNTPEDELYFQTLLETSSTYNT